MRGVEEMRPPRGEAPNCETCGAPAFNVNRYNEYTGRHSTIEECLHALVHRVAELERRLSVTSGQVLALAEIIDRKVAALEKKR